MRKIIFLIFVAAFLTTGLTSTALAQKQLGVITGRVTDNQGFPLPGAFIYVSSPALLGIQNYITNDSGNFVFMDLPPGKYRLSVEMPGFKTINFDDIGIRLGATLTIKVTMEASAVEEEITTKDIQSLLDLRSSKMSAIIDANLLKHIPMARSLAGITSLASGFIPDDSAFSPSAAVLGSTVRANTSALNGFNVNDSVLMSPILNVDFDIIEEVELEMAAHPAAISVTEGGYIHVVSKSGGNQFKGEARLQLAGEGMSDTLWTAEEMKDKQVPAPAMDKDYFDTSLSLGIPILSDRAWMFTNFRFLTQSRATPFSPWIDPQGLYHEVYDWKNRELITFVKVSGQVSSNIKFGGSFNFSDRYRPVAEFDPAWNLPEEATHVLDHERSYLGLGSVNFAPNQNTFIDATAEYLHDWSPYRLQDSVQRKPQYRDAITGYVWGSANVNETFKRDRIQFGAYLTRFQNGLLLGSTHEVKLGGEYEQTSGRSSSWKEDNLILDYANGSPYFYGMAESPATGNPVGKGRVAFYVASQLEGGLDIRNELKRFSAFLQDSVAFSQRLTLNLGLHFDYVMTVMPSFIKAASGNAVSYDVGEKLIKPVYGLNPYDENGVPEWKNMISWTTLSPRLGFIFDVFGDGKTAFKASFSRYAEYPGFLYSSELSPFRGSRSHAFVWFDENMDGLVDTSDSFELYPDDYRLYVEKYYRSRISPDLKAPFTQEITAGFEQEILKDFTAAVRFVCKSKNNIVENVLYAPDQNLDWYMSDQNTSAWWIPFQTVVPGIGDYPDTPVTVYFRSNLAPQLFDRLKNVPELKRTYQGIGLSFHKRMSHNWQLFGSLFFSKSQGNIGLNSLSSSGFSEAAASPNYFVNNPETSRLDLDRPIVAKLMGTFKFPHQFYLSAFFTHTSGAPWARSIIISPPKAWAENHQAFASPMKVYLENPGKRRYQPQVNLDLRAEKEFDLRGFGTLRVYLDVTNALASRYAFLDGNDGGFWFPDDENSTKGRRVLNSHFDRTFQVLGTRALRLNLNLSF